MLSCAGSLRSSTRRQFVMSYGYAGLREARPLLSRTPLRPRRGKGARTEPVLYDSRDLVTHAVCVGMTGSGKTGLCLALIEEAAIDGVPVIAIDPKGDLGNLLLTFPTLAPRRFPSVDRRGRGAPRRDDAGRVCRAAGARRGRNGLAEWGQDGARIERLRRCRRVRDLHAGQPRRSAGLDPELVCRAGRRRPRDAGAARGAGRRPPRPACCRSPASDAAPRSREHTLVATLLSHGLARGHATSTSPRSSSRSRRPPFQKVGVVDLESFFPRTRALRAGDAVERRARGAGLRAMARGRAARPASAPLHGGRPPRVSMFSIAHLGDAERMFFVSLLLNQIVGWMRAQTGTSSLRAIVYMDEIAGYFPPVANPPSKPPLLTLLKQGRAFGLGRRARHAESGRSRLQGAGEHRHVVPRPAADRARQGARARRPGRRGAGSASIAPRRIVILSALGKRVFLLHNVHEPAPAVFQTRWTLSYLRGPLSRDQIQRAHERSDGARVRRRCRLVAGRRRRPDRTSDQPAGSARPRVSVSATSARHRCAARDSAILHSAAGRVRTTLPARYVPVVLGAARVGFSDREAWRRRDRATCSTRRRSTDDAVAVDWAPRRALDVPVPALRNDRRRRGATYAPVPAAAVSRRTTRRGKRPSARWLSQTETRRAARVIRDSKLTSSAGESERDFRIRLQDTQARGARRGGRRGATQIRRQTGGPRRAAAARGGGGRRASPSRHRSRRCRRRCRLARRCSARCSAARRSAPARSAGPPPPRAAWAAA